MLLHFANIAWILTINVILVFSTRLKNQEFDRCLWSNTLMNMKIKQKICDIDRFHKLLILEYNEMIEEDFYSNENQVNATKSNAKSTNAINSNKKTIAKAILWQWHLRMRHCHLDVIQKLNEKMKNIEVMQEKSSKTIECETCAVSKIHWIIQRASIFKAIKSLQILYFDLIIDNQAFDQTRCIAHFTDELINFSWVYSLTDHKEKTLISVFRDQINKCDRADLIVRFMIRVIKCDQKTSVDLQLKNWVADQGNEWQWSVKHILEQNKRSERYEVMLTETHQIIELRLITSSPTEVLKWAHSMKNKSSQDVRLQSLCSVERIRDLSSIRKAQISSICELFNWLWLNQHFSSMKFR
jgi:hypothetical protein